MFGFVSYVLVCLGVIRLGGFCVGVVLFEF